MVECFLPKCQIVLGRFEEVAKQPSGPPKRASDPEAPDDGTSVHTGHSPSSSGPALDLGRDYNRQALFDEVKMPDQPFGKWFRGTIVPKAADRACFLLNGNRQSWHYGWQSSRLNCKNLHVFKVYFFHQSERDAASLTCVAALQSPPFRISSSRKARKTFRSPPISATPVAHGAMPTPVPSIDEFLGKQSTGTGAFPLEVNGNGVPAAPLSSNSYLAARPSLSLPRLGTEKDQAGRVRKRLTRSASLKSEYFASVPFPPMQPAAQNGGGGSGSGHHQLRHRLSATHPAPQLSPFHEDRASTPALPSMSFLSATTPSSGGEAFHNRRSSLAALPMPVSAPMPPPASSSRAVPVLTPITGMMQLRLESHPQDASPYSSTPSSSSSTRTSSSRSATRTARSMSSSAVQAPPSRLTAAALHQHAYASANPYSSYRRDLWPTPAGGYGPSAAGFGGIPALMMAASPNSMGGADGFLNRKRNRSTDSDKAIAAAIDASEHIVPTPSLSPLSSPGHTGSSADSFSNSPPTTAAAVAPADLELFRRARVLQLAFTIVRRIHRFEQVAKGGEADRKVVRHSFEMLTPAPGGAGGRPALVQIPLSKPKLLHLCSNLVTVCTRLMRSGVAEDVRQKLHDCAQSGCDVRTAYAQLVALLDDAVHEQVSRLPRHMHKSWGDAESEDEGVWDLYDMLKSCEPWLVHEPWWAALDDSSDDEGGADDATALPFLSGFTNYYRAIQEAMPSPQDLEVAASLRRAALSGAGGLTGEWVRLGDADDHAQPLPRARNSTAAAAASWFERHVHAHMTEIFHVTETATTMTLALPNSLVSANAVFLLQLDQSEPTVVIPQDYFPFGWAKRRAMMAYRAWRVRDVGDENGSAVAVQFMRWPGAADDDSDDDDDDDEDEDAEEPEEEPHGGRRTRQSRRTRITLYFSASSPSRLQLRTIVETSLAASAPLRSSSSSSSPGASTPPPSLDGSGASYPTEAEMLQYFKSPSSWELRAQTTQQYEKKL